ncbi:protein kinase [Nocardia sp. NPDC050712]|uniref:serine/threonine-protein kinase n=1 Tax=Nocardia sp. NPDC050712 TaxID=3155518 RepID=UPI003406C684
MLASGDVFAGYVIERQVGRGGMGSVYLAKHPRLPRMTALKLLNREMFHDDEVRARFEREADLVSRLDHPNIVTVYDRGLDDEQLWISMQYIDGIDAASAEPQSLPPARAVQIIKETGEALDYAHGMGVLHRDVKPANILLARSGGGRGERVYLTDFGIARLRDDTGHLTQTGTFTATLAYASLEQLTGSPLDHRSDQYSLACTLFWLFTGSGPFASTNPAQVIQGHLQTAPPALSSVRPGLPYALDGVLAKAMAKRPDDRFNSCSEFAAAAQQALSDRSQPALPLAGGGPRPGTGPQFPTAHTSAPQLPTTGGQHPSSPQQPTYPVGQASGPHSMSGAPTALTPAPRMIQHAMPGVSTGPQQTAPTSGYAQQNAYHPPGGYNAPPRPPIQRPGGPPRKSNAGLIVGVVAGAVVLVIGLLAVIGVVVGDDTDPTTTRTPTASASATSTSSASNSPATTASVEAISREFSSMVPTDPDGDAGYNGATCSSHTASAPPNPTDGTPDFGKWGYAWDCYGGGDNDDPFYTIYMYNAAADVQAALSNLPGDTVKSTETNGGKSYTSYKFNNSGPKLVTVFTGSRGQYLMYTDGIAGSIDEVLRWWRSAPL